MKLQLQILEGFLHLSLKVYVLNVIWEETTGIWSPLICTSDLDKK